MVDELVIITFTILLPITPAYILYRALPSEAKVSGPFKGLNIQLSGAFAGYFLLVLLIFGYHYSQPKKSQYEVWEVRGQLKATPGASAKEGAVLSLLPSTVNVDANGQFDVLIATTPGLNGGLKFPKLHIEHPDYQTVDIDLNETQPRYGGECCHISKNERDKALKFNDFVVLKRKGSDNEAEYDRSGSGNQVAVPISISEVKP